MSSPLDYLGAPFSGFEIDLRRIFGTNSDVDDTLEDVIIQGGTYVYPPSSGIQLMISSTSTSDTAAGTGVRSVDLHYLDSGFVENREIIYLSGTTPAYTIATDIRRINGFHSELVGSGGVAAGNISLMNISGTQTYGYIIAGLNASQQAVFTVPSGMTGYISCFKTSSASGAGSKWCKFFLRVTTTYENEYNAGVFQVKDLTVIQDGTDTNCFSSPIICPEFTDIKVSVQSQSNANADTACSVDIFLKNNNWVPNSY